MNPVDPAGSLPDHLKPFLARLGAFNGGAQETLLLAITGLAQVGPKSDLATGVTRDTWPELREHLLTQGLIREEALPGSARPYLRFTSAFADADWSTLSDDQRDQLIRRHQRHYFQYIGQMKKLRTTHAEEARTLVHIEQDNLLNAVNGVIDKQEEWALEFVERLAPFLDDAGLNETSETLRRKTTIHYDPEGSPGWIRQMSNQVERLIHADEYDVARNLLTRLIDQLPDDDPFALMANLARRAYCSRELGALDTAREDYENAIDVSTTAPASKARSESLLRIHTDIAGLMAVKGNLIESMNAGQRALREAEALKDWETMANIARIQVDLAAKIGDQAKTAAYKRLVRLALSCTKEGKEYLAEQQGFIRRVALAANNDDQAEKVENMLVEGETAGWHSGAAAMREILAGERDENRLCEGLETHDSLLVHAILQAIPHVRTESG